ncbi:MAG: hypothetical protein LUD39_00005, partial [Opitutae bacterium]|nr:hypothetical protein [Opitutae bacterium]
TQIPTTNPAHNKPAATNPILTTSPPPTQIFATTNPSLTTNPPQQSRHHRPIATAGKNQLFFAIFAMMREISWKI